MCRYCLTIIIALMFSEPVLSAPTTINCITDPRHVGRDFKYKIRIDIDKKIISIGKYSYDIVQINDDYISAYSPSDGVNVGGEILVINRVNGHVKRAAVYIAATEETFLNKSESPYETGILVSKEFSSTCSKPIL